jgi:glycosyltransferase involved in cell wall biosynthesis
LLARFMTMLRADPCRFAELLFDARMLRRTWHGLRARGWAGLSDELEGEAGGVIAAPRRAAAVPDRAARGRILVIDRSLPRFDRDAGSRSSFQYVELFLEMGLDVSFLPNDQLLRQPYARMLSDMGVTMLAGKEYRCGRWKRWLGKNPGRFDIVFLHRPNIAIRYLDAIRALLPGAKIVYCGHDLRHWRDRRRFEVGGDRFYLDESRYWEKIEDRIFRQVDGAYFFSDVEVAEIRRRHPDLPARTIPLYPEAEQEVDDGMRFEHRTGLLFVGGFMHEPNVDAMRWFATEVLPLVHKRLPRLTLFVVGGSPPPAIAALSALAHGRISIEGAVSEDRLRDLYRSCRVAVAPLRFGAGIKGKVVEAIRRGMPLVTTTVGAEGIAGASDAFHVDDTPAGFAEKIFALYDDPAAWHAMQARMRELARSRFSRAGAMETLMSDFGLPASTRTRPD